MSSLRLFTPSSKRMENSLMRSPARRWSLRVPVKSIIEAPRRTVISGVCESSRRLGMHRMYSSTRVGWRSWHQDGAVDIRLRDRAGVRHELLVGEGHRSSASGARKTLYEKRCERVRSRSRWCARRGARCAPRLGIVASRQPCGFPSHLGMNTRSPRFFPSSTM